MTTRSIPDSWGEILDVGTPLVCGILNVTPDSFSDGGQYANIQSCEKQFNQLVQDGAHIIDVGAESTRPGAREVYSDEELDRLHGAFEVVASQKLERLVSIDTRHARTALAAIGNGFHIINDVSGATFDPDMPAAIADSHALCIVMHMRGTPEIMMELNVYDDIIDDVTHELEARVEAVMSAGVLREKIMIDPGIGFGKDPQDNVTLIEKCSVIKERLALPMMVGLSRKSVVSYLLTGDISAASVAERDILTAQLSRQLADQGIDAIRVHDVALSVQALAQGKQ